MNTIIEKLKTALSQNSLLHGLLMAILGAISTPLLAWADSISQSMPFVMPDYKHFIGMAMGAGVMYLIKNLLAGSSAQTIDIHEK